MEERWSESDSTVFLELADVITPSRTEQWEMISRLMPSAPRPFRVVELGCGDGSLGAWLLEGHPEVTYVGLDGSEVMLRSAKERLRRWEGSVELDSFDLTKPGSWLSGLRRPVHGFVSSLVVHHLDDTSKESLYRALYEKLEPNGALLLIDVVRPTSDLAARAVGQNWNEIVEQQAGDRRELYTRFKEEGWNCYTHPDPMDKPTSLFRQLMWLDGIGFRDVDCFWLRAGHAVFGGYKP